MTMKGIYKKNNWILKQMIILSASNVLLIKKNML